MKFLHTSDWHLGRSLHGRKRYDEFSAFLAWLKQTIASEHIDTLLVAGDIFDTSTPSNRAQTLYYQFLCDVSQTACRHIIIIAGNHDSPSFLDAPKALLRTLHVHVVGAMTADIKDEMIVLHDPQGQPEAIVCAVPYLRDKDIRTVEPGESMEDKNTKLIQGLRQHYAHICALAEDQQKAFLSLNPDTPMPIIAMGHLFSSGGKTVDGDGVRELYVGSLAHVDESLFPACIDYLALGHLHVPQCVGKAQHLRYSGSPIPMGYGEAKQEKQVLLVECAHTTPSITAITVPCFQALERIAGSLDDICTRITQLKQAQSHAWLEIDYTGAEMIANLRTSVEAWVADSTLEVLQLKNRRITERILSAAHQQETLDDLNETEVFQRCLDSFEVLPEDRLGMTQRYQQIIQSIKEEDLNAE